MLQIDYLGLEQFVNRTTDALKNGTDGSAFMIFFLYKLIDNKLNLNLYTQMRKNSNNK